MPRFCWAYADTSKIAAPQAGPAVYTRGPMPGMNNKSSTTPKLLKQEILLKTRVEGPLGTIHIIYELTFFVPFRGKLGHYTKTQ